MREFLDVELAPGTYEPGLGMASGSSKELSRKLGERGWLGMALPKEYGGGERSVVERFVVVEELLRRGAPLEHHWTADRQSGPVINRFGSEALKRRFLPLVCRGEVTFSIGMSEPDAGSDLASVACRALKVEGGYELSGTKIWTSNAHFADYAIVLCRTSDEEDRHAGLSQLIVDLHSPGVTVNPIPFLDGTSDFNEVVFDASVRAGGSSARGRGSGLGAEHVGAQLRARRSRAVDLPVFWWSSTSCASTATTSVRTRCGSSATRSRDGGRFAKCRSPLRA